MKSYLILTSVSGLALTSSSGLEAPTSIQVFWKTITILKKPIGALSGSAHNYIRIGKRGL
jgi:phosphoenolpyruvate synthase/pyruvate phosphate dikinase